MLRVVPIGPRVQEGESMPESNDLVESICCRKMFSKDSFKICLFYCSKPRLKLAYKHTPQIKDMNKMK